MVFGLKPSDFILSLHKTYGVGDDGENSGSSSSSLCHRYALAKNTVNLSGESLTEKQMAELLWAGYGRFDPIFFINQADTSDLAQRGERICAMLRDFGARRAVTASLHVLKKSYKRG